ncbi:bucky ball-like isoform X2 [Festucalex cinctus]
MEDYPPDGAEGAAAPHDGGNGQQGSQRQGPRPFFYVQPPSQPYFQHQHHWQTNNNPYNQFGVPPGFPFGHPYMIPHQYVPYPGGFPFSPVPMFSMDSRRTFEPRFYPPVWNDGAPRPRHYTPRPRQRREMTTAEVQTEPNDGFRKMLDFLNKMRIADKELDSGVASHSSGIFSLAGEKKDGDDDDNDDDERGGGDLAAGALDATRSEAAVFDDPAVNGAQSGRRGLDDASKPNICWSARLPGERPLDGSSVGEYGPRPEHAPLPGLFLACNEPEALPEGAAGIQADIPVADHSTPKRDADDTAAQVDFFRPSGKDVKNIWRPLGEGDADYKILWMPPSTSLFSAGARGSDFSSLPPPPYYYRRLSTQTSQESASVFSPSLDDDFSSSRDEMFSTDADDSALFPRRSYRGRRPARAAAASNAWPPLSKELQCDCCGKSLHKGASRSRFSGSAREYRDQVVDSEDDFWWYGRGGEPPFRAPSRRRPASRKPHSVSPRLFTKKWSKYRDQAQMLNPNRSCDGGPGEASGHGTSVFYDRGETEQLKRADGTGGFPRRWRAATLLLQQQQQQQQQELCAPWRELQNQKSQDDDDEDQKILILKWELGPFKKKR